MECGGTASLAAFANSLVLGPASLPAKTTGTEAGSTDEVNESPTLRWAEKMCDRI